jgi:MFS family permease
MTNIKEKGIKLIRTKLFGKLRGNALVYAETEPIWALIAGLSLYYYPMYMKALGVTEIQMGLLNSVAGIFGAITAIVSGPLTDKMGRRTTTVIFNIVSWSFAMAIWALSQNFWYFLVASIVNAFIKIPAISGNCLVVEDTPCNKRCYYFSFIILVNLASGLFTPITGILINILGLVPAMRLVYLLCFLITTSLFLLRYRRVKETKLGNKLMRLRKRISIKRKAKDYLRAIKYIIHTPLTLVAFIIVILTNFQLGFSFFTVVYLSNVLQFPVSIISKLPVITALVNFAAYFTIIPKLHEKDETNNLVLGLSLSVISAAIFLTIGKGDIITLMISTAIGAVGNMIMFIFRDTLWSNVIDEKQRTNVLSECQALISLMAVPSGVLSGLLYSTNAKYPFMVVLGILTIALSFGVYAYKIKQKINNDKLIA